MQVNKALHTDTSWYAYAAMFSSLFGHIHNILQLLICTTCQTGQTGRCNSLSLICLRSTGQFRWMMPGSRGQQLSCERVDRNCHFWLHKTWLRHGSPASSNRRLQPWKMRLLLLLFWTASCKRPEVELEFEFKTCPV